MYQSVPYAGSRERHNIIVLSNVACREMYRSFTHAVATLFRYSGYTVVILYSYRNVPLGSMRREP
jgi:hypothetical protein